MNENWCDELIPWELTELLQQKIVQLVKTAGGQDAVLEEVSEQEDISHMGPCQRVTTHLV